MPRVTVALAVYNGAATLREALETVFAQTYKDYDVLILDDGSTDESVKIAQEFPVRLIQQANAGLGAGRKRLTEEATGDYIAFIDHDDFWLPRKLELQMASIESGGFDLVHADGWYIYEDGREVPRDWSIPSTSRAWGHILPSNRVIASSAIYRREAMLAAGNFVADTVRCSDWYGWMLLAPGNRFHHLPEKLVRYNVLSTSLANAGYRFHAAQLHILENHFVPKLPTLMEDIPAAERRQYLKLIQQNIGVALSGMARHKRAAGEKREARALAIRALKASPTTPKVLTRSLSVLLT